MANKMTVKELIRKLQKYPDDMKVYISSADGYSESPSIFEEDEELNALTIAPKN